jgi:hypothetical protein
MGKRVQAEPASTDDSGSEGLSRVETMKKPRGRPRGKKNKVRVVVQPVEVIQPMKEVVPVEEVKSESTSPDMSKVIEVEVGEVGEVDGENVKPTVKKSKSHLDKYLLQIKVEHPLIVAEIKAAAMKDKLDSKTTRAAKKEAKKSGESKYSTWVQAVKQWNDSKGGQYVIPLKGTSDYTAVKKIQDELKK